MSDTDATGALREQIVPVLQRHGLVLEELTVSEGEQARVEVVVDLPEDEQGSPDLDTVADASRDLSELLDAPDSPLGEGPALLEVGTPGAERVLELPRHYRRARGRLLRLDTVDGRTMLARLLEVDDHDVLHVEPQPERDEKGRIRGARRPGTPVDLPIDQIAHAQVQIEFDPPADLRTGAGQASPNDAEER